MEAFWLRQVDGWSRPGIGVRTFCDNHTLSEPCFYYWRRRFIECGLVVRPKVGTSKVATPAFVSVRVESPTLNASAALNASPPSAIEVVLANGRVLRVPTGFDAETLRRVVGALETFEPAKERSC